MKQSLPIKKIAQYSRSAKQRKIDNTTILDGLHVVQEAFSRGNKKNLTKILVSTKGESNHEIMDFLNSVPKDKYEHVSDRVMEKIAPTKTPPGILGLYSIPKSPTTLHTEIDNILLLDRVADPGNLGTIIRCAAAMGTQAIFSSPGCADIWSPKVLRAAQGAHFYIEIFPQFELRNIKKLFDGRIIGTCLDESAQSLYKTDLTSKTGIVLGNEGAGINLKEFKQYGDEKIYIPMSNKFESINVAISASICLSEKKRQNL